MKNIWILGDSIAYGMNDEIGNGWANAILGKIKSKFECRTNNLSYSGDTIVDSYSKFLVLSEKESVSHLIIASGINDNCYYEGSSQTALSLEKSLRTWKKILDLSKDKNIKTIVVGSIPVREKLFQCVKFLNSDIVKYNKAVNDLCNQYEIQFIDLFSHFIDDETLYSDPMHPNTKGHELIESIVDKFLCQVITK